MSIHRRKRMNFTRKAEIIEKNNFHDHIIWRLRLNQWKGIFRSHEVIFHFYLATELKIFEQLRACLKSLFFLLLHLHFSKFPGAAELSTEHVKFIFKFFNIISKFSQNSEKSKIFVKNYKNLGKHKNVNNYNFPWFLANF